MTRAIWYCSSASRGARPPSTRRTSRGPRIVVPLIILAGLAVVAGFANLPDTGVALLGPRERRPALRALRRAHRRLLPGASRPHVRPPRVHPLDRRALHRWSALVGVGLAYLWFWQGPRARTASPSAHKVGPGRLHGAREQVLPRPPLHRRHRRRHQGPDRPGRQLGQPERDRRRRQPGRHAAPVEGGQWVYKNIDQGVVDTIVNGSGATAEGSGQLLRKQQTGKVQTYGAYLFAGATILAAIFVFIASAN